MSNVPPTFVSVISVCDCYKVITFYGLRCIIKYVLFSYSIKFLEMTSTINNTISEKSSSRYKIIYI
jgi:hypothetical protein